VSRLAASLKQASGYRISRPSDLGRFRPVRIRVSVSHRALHGGCSKGPSWVLCHE